MTDRPDLMADLDHASAARVHYTDPRVRQLAEARWRLTTGGTRMDWLCLGKDNPEALIREGRDWIRAAVAAGILPPPALWPAPAAPVYDRRAWETYQRDAKCGCTAPDPADCARQHVPGPWMCVCHRLSVVPTAAELAAAKAEHGDSIRLTVDTDAVDPEPDARCSCGQTTPLLSIDPAGGHLHSAPDQLTADEARAEVERLSTDLYQAQDAVAFVAECLTIWEREQPGTPVPVDRVRRWLEGAKCGRQLAAEAGAARASVTQIRPADQPFCAGAQNGPAPADLRQRYTDALANAHRTHPCICGATNWSSCFHPGAPSHEERRADAVMAVRDTELEQARAERDDLQQRADNQAQAAADLIEQLRRAETELARRDAAESADAAAGSYAARAEQAEATIARVRALHQPDPNVRAGWKSDADPATYGRIARACTQCGAHDLAERWPCPTIRALDGTQQPTVNPPGSTREQLPDGLLARLDLPPYRSTACQTAVAIEHAEAATPAALARYALHADDLHARCRLNHKFTGQRCTCGCHGPRPAAPTRPLPVDQIADGHAVPDDEEADRA